MAEEHGTLTAFGVIFTCWATVFFGVWVTPLADTSKIILDILSTFAFVLFGVFYFVSKGKIPPPSKETWEKVRFWYDIVVYWTFAGLFFWFGILAWDIKTINSVYLVTYSDLASLGLGVFGILLIVYTIWRIKYRNPFKRTRKR